MIIYYRLPGALAVIALIIYTLTSLSIFKLIPITLTLSGIAGFILSIGMAVDANVLIFERTKEELRKGKTLSTAIEEGFVRAWSSIFDSNTSTLITCFILAYFGTGTIKGFAITLAIGVLLSMFSAVTVTKNLLKVAIMLKKFQNPWFFGVKSNSNIK
jgi:preprotein translocase subunit SecD